MFCQTSRLCQIRVGRVMHQMYCDAMLWWPMIMMQESRPRDQCLFITVIYFILGVKSCPPTFLVAIYANCRLPSHQSILYILHFSPFLKEIVLLAKCLVWLVSLPFLAIHIVDLLSKTIRGASSGTMSGYLLKFSWFNILKYAKAIPAVHA